MSKKKICPCGEKSIPGLVSGVSLCQRHYNGLMFGTGKDRNEALQILNLCKKRHENK